MARFCRQKTRRPASRLPPVDASQLPPVDASALPRCERDPPGVMRARYPGRRLADGVGLWKTPSGRGARESLTPVERAEVGRCEGRTRGSRLAPVGLVRAIYPRCARVAYPG